MAITSTGIGSNLDVEGIITKLMAIEQKPLTALSTKEAGFQAKISALGSLKGTLSALQGAASALIPDTGSSAFDKFSVFNTTIADTNIASATTASSAVAGTYSLEVTQLAQQHRIATKTGVGNPFDSSNKLVGGGGTLTITLDTLGESSPTKTTALNIADGATPEGIRDAINAAKAGVSATVINGTAGKQLVLVSDTVGSDQNITLSGIAGLSYDGPGGNTDQFTELQAAQGSKFKLNGIEISANSNTISTAIDGITLNLLKKSETDVATTLTVSRDNSSLEAGVNALVKAYNDFNTTANSLGSYNATTKVAGTLNGDSTLRAAQSILRSAVGNALAGLTDATLKRLSDIGVSMQKDGSLAVNSTKLSAAIKTNLTGVANLVAAYGSIFKTATDGLVGTNGSITTRTAGINTSIKGLGKQSEAIVTRLALIEARYRKQFTALDVAVGQLKQTSDYLTQQLANLPGFK
ncbi:MAG: flagellar filament capping protein FliD [Propionivibrio sp.]|uniref:flagellar filament capping protein FliD n=1 Tax=Propionivibrio sp. TaxID=2212460 RepID=UPI0025E798C4|nr:flagellar filament capping protein FliD [Propionivibrio sp.]MBL0207798.1 flagellar filament capping protein FliD [Propionivibrio sp.]